MSTRNDQQQTEDYRRIELAIKYLEDNFRSQPNLDEIARAACLSKYHFERLFKRWAGVSPVQFLQFLTLEYARERLADSRSLLDTSLDAGLSGPSRLHDLFVTFEALTPGEYKQLGSGLRISYGFHATPFGDAILAETDRGICHLGFVGDGGKATALAQMRCNWPDAEFVEAPSRTGSTIKKIFVPASPDLAKPFHLLLKGTNFQINVWRALLALPRGHLVCYQDIAGHLGRLNSTRAVASAIARNPVAYLIPCHRVISKTGRAHNYRWGSSRKKAIIGWESAQPL
jgi:AraC family transcriptional regulator of adaptative response/methylated-DNA-[protein]-cysteine methyltransferase